MGGMTVPVVLLHALGLDSRMWVAQQRALSRAGNRVWAPEQRGTGESSLDAAADDLARGLDAMGATRAVLVGASMGGYVAMAFLRRHPGRTAALALLGTRGEADDAATAAQRRAFADAILDPATRPGLIAATLPSLVGGTTLARRPEVVEQITTMVSEADPAVVAWCQRAIADRRDSFDVLRAADVPAVVIAGAEDALVPAAETQRLSSALGGEHVVVPGAGHLVAMEAPDAVNATLDGLLRRVSREREEAVPW